VVAQTKDAWIHPISKETWDCFEPQTKRPRAASIFYVLFDFFRCFLIVGFPQFGEADYYIFCFVFFFFILVNPEQKRPRSIYPISHPPPANGEIVMFPSSGNEDDSSGFCLRSHLSCNVIC